MTQSGLYPRPACHLPYNDQISFVLIQYLHPDIVLKYFFSGMFRLTNDFQSKWTFSWFIVNLWNPVHATIMEGMDSMFGILDTLFEPRSVGRANTRLFIHDPFLPQTPMNIHPRAFPAQPKSRKWIIPPKPVLFEILQTCRAHFSTALTWEIVWN